MTSIINFFYCRLSGIFFCSLVVFFSSNLFANEKDFANNIKVDKIFFLDGVVLDDLIILVGEQGILCKSNDGGKSWKKIHIANKKTLTSIAFNKKNIGILVGHNGTLMRSVDGGNSFNQIKNNFIDSHHTFMRVKWINENSVVAIGSFGLFIRSDDQGRTWKKKLIIDRDFDWHLYDFISLKKEQLLFGEAGTILYKKNNSKNWVKISSPYKGSFFGAIKQENDKILAFGMRGKIFELSFKRRKKNMNKKNTFEWKEIHTNSKATIMSSLNYSPNKVLFFADSGLVFLLDNINSNVYSIQKEIKSFAGGIKLKDGTIFGYGLNGYRKVDIDSFDNNVKNSN